jgi:hypothetical protein
VKKILPIILALIIIGAGIFYGGMKYGQGKTSSGSPSGQNFQNLTPEQRQQLLQGNVGGSLQRGAGRGDGANFLSGEVINKDAQSLTIKMPDNSSKIVFFSDSTKVSKTIDGSANDIETGKQIMVSGSQNSDGSYTAQTIQIRQLPLPNADNSK